MEHYSARKNKLLINVGTWITFKTVELKKKEEYILFELLSLS